MKYKVELSGAAQRHLQRLDEKTRVRVLAAALGLADNPRPPGCRKLSGTVNEWRIRVGQYRVIYEIHDAVLLVLVIEAGHRSNVYRRR